MNRLLCLALLLAGTVAPALAGSASEPARDDILHVTYACAGGETLEVVFLNTAGGNSYAVVRAPDGLLPMQVAISASGARYVALSPEDGRVFWTKGSEATLYAGPDGEQALLTDCSTSDF